ncbi:redoxin domain-containing protein [Marinimicrobium sp. ARAG 43.8]|uniref:redoxin domain-containing protein n=1 Tax=Marinimicrobium sp. ARAG 43.8 TaxID=3418719 RepID=UPI003CE8F681
MKSLLYSAICLTALMSTPVAWADAVPGDPAPAFRATDAGGHSHTLTEAIGGWLVLEWLTPECDAVQQRYRDGTLPALQEAYREKGVTWLTVISSSPGPGNRIEPEDALALASEYGMQASAPILLDDTSIMARAYGVSTAPNFFLIDPHGKVLYRGALQSEEAESSKATALEAALQSALAGEPVDISSTEAKGCTLELDVQP